MRCAPVAITTLNRYKHLKQCIDSLKKNKHANETDLYISLDFPPSEKYTEGYNKVKEYLKNGISGFRNVYIYMQESNLGPGDNSDFLFNKIWETEDRLIFTEDDNVFSECFLDYINKSLEKYEEDPMILAVGGYCWPVSLKSGGKESYRTDFFSWWGCGIWKKKFEKIKDFEKADIRNIMIDKKKRGMLKKKSRYIYEQALYIVNDKHHMQIYKTSNTSEFREADFILDIYMYVNNLYMLLPYISKVRNIGLDDSGQNCNESNYKRLHVRELDRRREVGNVDADDLNEMEKKKVTLLIDKGSKKSIKTFVKQIIMENRIKES